MSAFKIVSGSTRDFLDTQQFIDSLGTIVKRIRPALDNFLGHRSEIVITRAPGRLDVMGGIADYSGSLVLELPIAGAVHVAMQQNHSETLRVASFPAKDANDLRVCELGIDKLKPNGTPISYANSRDFFAQNEKDHWVAYIAGAYLVLMRELGFASNEGADILISSAVPEGKGVSSSAALEVAAMNAVIASVGINVGAQRLALLCQKVENEVVGAACGVMDQMTAECGEADRLLELLCQPCELEGTIAIPDELEFWGIDSGIRHSVGGSDYTTVRTAAFMGYRMIAAMEGFATSQGQGSPLKFADPKWNGYLANITPKEFESSFAAKLPEEMTGKQFLQTYNGTTDSVTRVNPETSYPVFQATKHPIYEHDRVRSFANTLKNWRGLEQASTLGQLMFESHRSYSSCGLGSPETDLIASLVRDSAADLYGARITGGGSGGTVAVLGRRGKLSAVEQIAHDYQERTGNVASIISGSSPGAHIFQHLTLEPDQLSV